MKKIFCAICCLILISGCTWCSDKRIVIKPKSDPVNNRTRWMVLAYHVEKYYDTMGWTTEEIAAELALAQYYLNIKTNIDEFQNEVSKLARRRH